MKTRPIRLAFNTLLALGLASCSPAPPATEPLLNSERILQRYGSYGVELLRQEDALRVACLYSEAAAGRVCRTVAVTLLDPPRPELAEASAAILAGASMGATLQAAGWQVVKRDHFLFERDSTPGFASLLGWPAGEPPPQVAVDAYALWVVRPGQSYRFARIAEAHHPDYLDLPTLRTTIPRNARVSASLKDWWPDLDHALSQLLLGRSGTAENGPD